MSDTPTTPPDSPATTKGHILVVDDNPNNLKVLNTLLTENDYMVRPSNSGAVALESARAIPPDLVLLDIKMPGMDGYEVCRRLKADERSRDIPVIFISALGETVNKVKAFSLGGVDYITKPFQAEEVLARLKTHLSLRNLQKQLIDQNVRLQREIKARRKADAALQRNLDELEVRVEQRTSELARANEALRESEERYRIAIEHSNDAVSIGRDTFFLYVNRKFLDVWGYDDIEEVIGKPIAEFIHPLDRERIVDYTMRRQNKEAAPSRYECRGLRKSGEPFWIEVSATRTMYRNKPVSLAFIRDITERKRVEKQLRQSQKMEAIGTLAGGIAHDFNNILGVIIGCAEIAMLDLPRDAAVRPDLERVIKAGFRAKELVKQILTFSRQTENEARPIIIQPILKETLKFLRSSLPATISIKQRLPPGDRFILADPTQVQQIVMNLCTNAGHSMRDTGGELEVALHDAVLSPGDDAPDSRIEPGPYLVLTIRDTGEGMSRHIMDRMFDPFFTTKSIGEGTGLGLSVVHGIVKSMGGAISAESEPGAGATFQVLLPRIAGARVRPETEQTTPLPGGAEHVLIVDDEPMLIEVLERMLHGLGYRTEAETSPVSALKRFRRTPDAFDVVITDLTMPEMTGDELARNIRGIRPDLPIILCTGYSETISEESLGEAGVGSMLLKPVIRSKLARTLREAIGG